MFGKAKRGVQDGLQEILETRSAHDKDPSGYTFSRLHIVPALWCYYCYRGTCSIGSLTYMIISILYLVTFHSMIYECNSQKHLWYYLLLSQCAILASTFWLQCIATVQCAKLYFRILRHLSIMLVGFGFGSYGSVVLTEAKTENISQECSDSVPYKFRDLVYATQILAYITGAWFLVLGVIQIYGNVKWLCNRGSKIRYSKISHNEDIDNYDENDSDNEHDPSLIIGKNTQYGYNDDPYKQNTNNNKNSKNMHSPSSHKSKSKSESADGSFTSLSIDDDIDNEFKDGNSIELGSNLQNQNINKRVFSTRVGSNDGIVQDGIYRGNYSKYRQRIEKLGGTALSRHQKKESELEQINQQKKMATQFGEFDDGTQIISTNEFINDKKTLNPNNDNNYNMYNNNNDNNNNNNDKTLENIDNQIIQLKPNADVSSEFESANKSNNNNEIKSSIVIPGNLATIDIDTSNVSNKRGVRHHQSGNAKHRTVGVKMISPSLLGDGI